MRCGTSTYLFSLFILTICSIAKAKEYVIPMHFEEHTFSSEIEYGHFDTISTTPQEILLLPDSMFLTRKSKFFNLGYFKSPFWFKTTLVNKSDITQFNFCIEQLFFDSLRVSFIYKNSIVSFPLQGIRMYSPNRLYNQHFFPFHLEKNQKVTIVFKLSNATGSLRSYFNLYSKNKQAQIAEKLKKAPIRDAFFTGFLASVAIATFLFYLINHNITYLYYALFVLTNLITQLNIKGQLLSVWVMTKDVFPRDFRAQLALSMYFFALLYARSFFKNISTNRFILKISNIASVGLIISFLISLWGVPENEVIKKTILLLIILIMGLTIISNFGLVIEGVFKRYKPAYFFFIGYLIPFIVAMIYFLMQMQLISGGYFAELWGYGLAIEIIVLSISLSLKTRDIRYQNKLLNEKLIHQQEAFIKQTIELQEAERAKIARDLHDGLGQRLTGLKLNWFTLSKTLPEEDKESKTFTSSLQEAIEEVRMISHQMLPKNLMKAGIIHAIEALCDSINSNSCKVNFSTSIKEISLIPDIAIHLYRSTQECIQNAIRHGRANEIHIHLAIISKNIVLQIHDNGIGFDTKTTEKGFGILNISNRIKSINGFYSIESSLKSGTSIIIRIPYEKD